MTIIANRYGFIPSGMITSLFSRENHCCYGVKPFESKTIMAVVQKALQ